MLRWSRKTDCYVPWPARSSWPSCHPRGFRGSGRLHPMDLPSEPPSLTMCLRRGAAAGCRALGQPPASFSCVALMPAPNPSTQGWELKAHYWPVPSHLVSPESPGLSGRGKTQDWVLVWSSSSMEEPSTTSFPGYQCSGDPPPPPGNRWPGKIWRFPGRPRPHPTLSPPSTTSPLSRGGCTDSIFNFWDSGCY